MPKTAASKPAKEIDLYDRSLYINREISCSSSTGDACRRPWTRTSPCWSASSSWRYATGTWTSSS
ncbi:hypothetical protein [Candidatus Methanomethylophilus sp. 1R26]|uniref:hypothetical protein n=1 Tax=Candidatus Methanomethylophilus sp. 1R26 TaxID=1769296 RepID=UPI001910CA41|nr:hypothetical protein [Candidatus Methanomethylophilus sp. 1R26]